MSITIPIVAEHAEPRLVLELIGTVEAPMAEFFTTHVWNSLPPSVVKVGRRLRPSEGRMGCPN